MDAPATSPRPLPRFTRRALVGALVAGGLLLAAEGTSRLVHAFPGRPQPLIADRQFGYTELKTHDHFLFWRMRPDASAGIVQTNNVGLRCPNVPADKGDEFRVLSLGESTTFGNQILYEDSYGAVLERSVDSVAGRPLRVINAGVGGYTLVQGYTYLARHGLALEPDAVLLYFGYNDHLPITYLHERDAEAAGSSDVLTDLELLRRRERLTARLEAWVFDHSNLYRGLSRWIAGTSTPEERQGRRRIAKTKPRVPPEDRLEILRRTRDLCAEHGIHLVIVVPWYREFVAHVPLLRRFARQNDLPLVDLPAILGPRVPDPAPLFKDAVHPGEEGHRRIAAAIREVALPLWEELARGEAGSAGAPPR